MKVHYAMTLSALLSCLVYVLACTTEARSDNSGSPGMDQGKAVYTQYCQVCHGPDGKLALNGAKDITQSALSLVERTELVRNGRNLMTPFNGILTEEEIQAVAVYSMTLGSVGN